MTLQQFIEENRDSLTEFIFDACPNCDNIDDDEIEMWIANEEVLYLWAVDMGVDV